jgi:hypothetical protein
MGFFMSEDNGTRKRRVQWNPVLAQAASIVNSYETGVTLRQGFYRLVAVEVLPNLQSYYRRLSSKTAEGRREGTFPDLLDRTSRIEGYNSFNGPEDAREFLRDVYRRDRTEGQPWTILLAVEKDGMSPQLDSWFTDPLGIRHVALGGYASQTLCDKVARYIERQGRPAVLIYAGDFDPTGIDIDRDFVQRVGCFDEVERVALGRTQVRRYGLPFNPDPDVVKKLEKDPRAARFKKRYGSLVQYEVDALDPAVLRDLYRNAIDLYHDPEVFAAVIERENEDRDRL